MKHQETWHQRRLERYFTEHYGQYEDTAEFYPDPAPNKWKFYISALNETIILECDDGGRVNYTLYYGAR